MSHDAHKGFRYGTRAVVCPASTTLAEAVAEQISAEREGPLLDSLDLIELGSVYVNEERCLNPARALKAGDRLRIHSAPRRFEQPTDLAARVLAETEDSLLVEKPAGLPSEPTVDNVKENLLSFLEDSRGRRFFLTHRLADESEGLMLIAKNQSAQARIARAFAEGDIRRTYVAYVETPLKTGTHAIFSILRSDELNASTNLIAEGRSLWQVAGAPLASVCRLEIEFTQARPKEIREALAAMGAPIIGDIALGSAVELRDSATQKSTLAFRALSLDEN